MMEYIAVICSSMKQINYLVDLAIDKAPNAFKERGKYYLITTNDIKYIFMSEQDYYDRKLVGFHGLEISGDEYEKMFICGFSNVREG